MLTSRSIRELVEQIVENDGRKGRATEALQALHERLEGDLQQASNDETKKRIRADLEYVTGYQETPAATIADLTLPGKPRRRNKKER